jgi:CBS domain-containing protein
MTLGIVTIGPHDSVTAARDEMRRHGIRRLVVVEDGRVVGIISDRDLGRVNEVGSDDVTVLPLMTEELVSASPATTVRQAANLTPGRTIGCLLVVEDDQMRGLVTTTDLLDQKRRCFRSVT